VLAADLADIPAYRAAVAHVTGHNMAKAGLEMALWDLFAQQAGQSLQAFIGGAGDRVRVGVSVGIQASPEKLVEVVGAYLAQGYRRIKLKIKPGRDVGDTAAVRRAHPDLLVQVDGNSVYRLADAEHLRKLDAFNLLLIEQPLAHDDIVDHARLQPRLATPVCLDESITSVDHARWALELGACRIINIKPGRVGGMHEATRLHDYCRAQGVPVWMGGMLETGIGRAANLAVASLPGFTLPGDISASARYYPEDIVDPPFTLNPDSTLSVPTGAGLGVNVVEERVRRATQREATFARA
jgi:O-succinylbenzoate synthase